MLNSAEHEYFSSNKYENAIKIFISCNENINVNKKKVDPDFIFFTAQREIFMLSYFVYNKMI